MKKLLLTTLTLLTLSSLYTHSFAAGAPTVYHAADDPVTAWFVKQLDTLGYIVPVEGQAYHWDDFFSSISPANADQLKQDDIVVWQDNGNPTTGLVISTQDGVILVKFPIGAGLVVMMRLDSPIVLIVRAHKKITM